MTRQLVKPDNRKQNRKYAASATISWATYDRLRVLCDSEHASMAKVISGLLDYYEVASPTLPSTKDTVIAGELVDAAGAALLETLSSMTGPDNDSASAPVVEEPIEYEDDEEEEEEEEEENEGEAEPYQSSLDDKE